MRVSDFISNTIYPDVMDTTMDREVRQRLGWVKLYEQTGNAGQVCRRCGISRPTLRKWWRRYQAEGEAGLQSRSRRPNHSPNRKVTAEHEGWVLQLRHERLLGARRIQHELKRHYGLHLATSTIHKILKRHQVAPLRRPPRKRRIRRYERDVPGDRVQLDTEFTAYDVRETLLEWGVKWRPNRARQPHLNGKVERVQKTDLDEFYATVDVHQSLETLNQQLEHYQDYYNWQRVHGTTGMTPGQRYYERITRVPLTEDVLAQFDPAAEEQRHRFFGVEWFLDEEERRKRLRG